MKFENKSLPKVRLAVMGQNNVGKSALTVRYLTKRFIGEYQSYVDLLYTQIIKINGKSIKTEIVDVFVNETDAFPEEPIQWADGFCLVYDISSRSSFLYVSKLLQWISRFNLLIPTILIGNKADLKYKREVTEHEGRALAYCHGCHFYDLSVAANDQHVSTAFDKLIMEALTYERMKKTQTLRFFKLIRAVVRFRKASPISYTGTLVVCQKSDLKRKKQLKCF